MSRARDIADLSSVSARLDTVGGSEGALSNRNVIQNGAMQCWQRGTSFSAASAAYNADRWSVDNNGGGGGQSTDAPDGFTYSLKVNPSSGSSVIRQAIELPAAGEGGVFRSGQKFTLSFYLKSDNAGEAINIFAASGTNVNATTTAQVNDTSTGLTTTTSWTRYTYTFTSNNVGGSDTCYNIVPYISSPSGDTYWTGVQLELGDTATDFEHRSYGDELLRCQRYYQETSNATNYSMVGDGTCQTSVVSILFDYLCEMRTSPSISALGTNGSSSWYIQSGSTTISTASSAFNGAWAAGTNSQRSWMDWTGISGQTASNTAAVYRNNQSTSNKNGCLAFDAEF